MRRLGGVWPVGLAVLAGAAQALALATPWRGAPLWWLQVASLAALVWLLDRACMEELDRCGAVGSRWRRGAGLTWCFATAWLTGSVWWLFISMHTYGGLAAPLASLAVLALAAALALFYAVAGGVYVRWQQRAGASPRAALVFGALWTLAELARGRWLTGFPWGAAGYAHTDGPLAGWAPWVGVYGVSALAASLAAFGAWWTPRVLRKGPHARSAAARRVVLGAAVLATVLWLPIPMAALTGPFTAPAGRLEVALLQGNIPQDEKFQPGTGIMDALSWYGTELQSATAPLVVAPETAIPLLPGQLPESYWAAMSSRYRDGDQAALIGLPLGHATVGYSNSALGLAPGQDGSYRYDKHHLVPFGEFIPPGFRWFTEMMQIPLGDFNRGRVGQPSLPWQGQRLAPNICYEDLFGEELGARFADSTQAPTALVNLSNIAWFGNTVAIDQHLQISRMRALEFERPMLRATNTGATVIIDHRGVVTHALPRHTRGVLLGEFEGRTGLTPYARWVSRFGLSPLWALALAVVVAAALRQRRQPAPARP